MAKTQANANLQNVFRNHKRAIIFGAFGLALIVCALVWRVNYLHSQDTKNNQSANQHGAGFEMRSNNYQLTTQEISPAAK